MNWAPESASNFSPMVDQIATYLVWVSIALTGVLIFLLTYFCVKYRKDSTADRGHRIQKPVRLEFGVSLLILLFALSVFIVSIRTFYQMAMPPKESQEIYVIAKQWMWTFQIPNHPDQINVLRVPLGRPARLIMTSQDVIHSFYVPAFRLKQDLVPGQYTSLWFTPEKLGTFPILCAEYCGLNHSQMAGAIEVISAQQFDQESTTSVSGSPTEQLGRKLFVEKGCVSCHEGSSPIGPALVNLMDQKVELSDGRSISVDDNYLRRSILQPQADIVKGYQPVMPTFQGQLRENELAALIAYLKSKKQ